MLKSLLRAFACPGTQFVSVRFICGALVKHAKTLLLDVASLMRSSSMLSGALSISFSSKIFDGSTVMLKDEACHTRLHMGVRFPTARAHNACTPGALLANQAVAQLALGGCCARPPAIFWTHGPSFSLKCGRHRGGHALAEGCWLIYRCVFLPISWLGGPLFDG